MAKPEMTPRERVLAALNHQEPDRVPLDLSQVAGDGITLTAYRNLLKHLGIQREPKVKNLYTQAAHVDEDVLQRLHIDVRGVGLGGPDGFRNKWLNEYTFEDEWGVVRAMPPGSFYYDLIRAPLAEDDTLAAVDRFRWPDPDNPGRTRGLGEKVRRLRRETEFAVAVDLNCSFFLRCCELRGWENFYTDLVANVEFAEALMDRYLEFRLRVAELALKEIGENADIIMVTSDDLGATDQLLVSPALYRKLIKPRMKRTFDFFRQRSDAKLYFHTDGAVYDLLPDFVEIGVDVLNPIQVSAVGMGDTAKLKREFGDHLTFWGAIDTHQALPYGSPADVRDEVRTRIRDLGPGGGYVICSVHNIQPEVPPENVVAMFDSAYELGRYPLNV